jgi:hypothetical protein
MKPRRFDGKFIVKVCPWKNHEFETDNPRKIYCCAKHQFFDRRDRARKREYAAREVVPTSSKPGASYNLRVREVLEAPPLFTASRVTEVKRYTKVPVRSMSGFQHSGVASFPVIDEGVCAHGIAGYCYRCDLG